MNKKIKNNIIIFTILQELRWASLRHTSLEVRIFSKDLLEKVEYELTHWKDG
ncbi:hypothetical protein QH639_19265 [Lysinibacillus sp. 1 U-2021]|uniref:hypothetical protein n=1 Tax=Lysinibacillus sp. 1 U-2021 TaxID=3039426 RepID=UPI00247FC229|nr:hypothetical protein [Lysinibacillus sp. 1 U-2021]WGT37943.1 hypothetical protein QH639_19265 [Lysinibacillus sp. 1 U-2021]